MRHQIKYNPATRSSSMPIFGSCLVFVLWTGTLISLSACAPQFKASVLSAENLVQDAELFGENIPESQAEATPTENLPATPEISPEATPEAAPQAGEAPSVTPEGIPQADDSATTTPAAPSAEAPAQTPGETVDQTPVPTPEVVAPETETTEDSGTETTEQAPQEQVTVVTPTETNGGTWFYLTKEFNIQDVEIDEQQNATAVERPQKIELMIEMMNFTQAAKANSSSVETSISADLGLNRMVELKTSFTRNAPRRIFKRGRWHIQAECQFHPTENKCEMVSYLAHVRFSFDRKTNPPQPEVHLESALAFYVVENAESVVHYKILPSSFRNFTELVTEMKSHANQRE